MSITSIIPLDKLRTAVRNYITKEPHQASRFFKVGPGDYAEGDRFLGVTTPNLRKLSKTYFNLEESSIQTLLYSPYNEERLLGLFILTTQYERGDLLTKEKIYQFYLLHIDQVNNWNLVDSSAHLIIGTHLWDKDRESLLTLAKSQNLWYRRIAIVATWYFIRKKDLEWTLIIAEMLLHDKEDLIHKAVGWMLREVGKQDVNTLQQFLEKHGKFMPRTMLRYAREHLNPTCAPKR